MVTGAHLYIGYWTAPAITKLAGLYNSQTA